MRRELLVEFAGIKPFLNRQGALSANVGTHDHAAEMLIGPTERSAGFVLAPTEHPFDGRSPGRTVTGLLGARFERLEATGHFCSLPGI
jgi:hypothetical protein